MPVSISLTASSAGLVEERHWLVNRLGFDLVRNGPASVAVHRVPALLKHADPEALVRSLLMGLEELDPSDPGDAGLKALVPALTAHIEVSRNEQSPQELDALLRQVEQEVEPSGALPLWVQLTTADIDGLFARAGPRLGAVTRRAKSP